MRKTSMGWRITNSNALEDAIFEMKLRVASHIGARKGMTVVELGCGQGGFTAAVAKTVGEEGRVLAVDVSNEYLNEFTERLDKYGVKNRVAFIQADGTALRGIVSDGAADLVTGFRLLEELKKCEDMPKVIGEMIRVAKNRGKVCLIELSTMPRNKAEEAYIRLHREGGDCFFKEEEIVQSMKEQGLGAVRVEEHDTDIWFSPSLAKQDLGFAQVWFDSNIEENLGRLVDKYGMKYPVLLIFSGQK
jgi:ubiquinone/menaquinone biosynthesis C-methylase UbiE